MPDTLHHILHVEDAPAIRRIVALALGRVGGFEVRSAESGAEALHMLSQALPQLLLLDVMMPDMDGPMLLSQLRARDDTATLPVMFMTAKGSDDERAHLRQLGAVAVLEKPFDPMTLAAVVRQHWAAQT